MCLQKDAQTISLYTLKMGECTRYKIGNAQREMHQQNAKAPKGERTELFGTMKAGHQKERSLSLEFKSGEWGVGGGGREKYS